MQRLYSALPAAGFTLLAAFLVVTSLRGYSDTTTLWVTSSLVTFAVCWINATHLLGPRAALIFIAIAVSAGWFAEQMGATRGWFFGDYDYTDVLGPTLGEVPIVVPLMWFSFTYMGYVIANLIVWHAPTDGASRVGETLLMSLLAAMIVTAYDLGADPYMVYVLKAWVMVEQDGAWFGETVQGFIGWGVVAFFIILAFRLLRPAVPFTPTSTFSRRHALVPVLIYAGLMASQVATGYPVETRSITVFAMGIPVLCALAGWRYWQTLQPGIAASAQGGRHVR